LLAAFPKLVGSESQHTFVETESVRYLYQPLETLYLILITSKQSNIMEDLDTLRLLGKLVCFNLLILVLVFNASEWFCDRFLNTALVTMKRPSLRASTS
jgi:hypothetical protein